MAYRAPLCARLCASSRRRVILLASCVRYWPSASVMMKRRSHVWRDRLPALTNTLNEHTRALEIGLTLQNIGCFCTHTHNTHKMTTLLSYL